VKDSARRITIETVLDDNREHLDIAKGKASNRSEPTQADEND
jgi:hypothetical protein